jgi:ribosomal protein L9
MANARLAVILQEDLPGHGLKGEEITVKRGFARNHLLPRKRAIYATQANKSKLADPGAKSEAAVSVRKYTEDVKNRLARVRLEFLQPPKANSTNAKPPSITARTIAAVLSHRYGFTNILYPFVHMPQNKAIEQWGTFEVAVDVEGSLAFLNGDSSSNSTSKSASTSTALGTDTAVSPQAAFTKLAVVLRQRTADEQRLWEQKQTDTLQKAEQRKGTRRKPSAVAAAPGVPTTPATSVATATATATSAL